MNNNKLTMLMEQQESLQQFMETYNNINSLEVINYLKAHLEQYKKLHNISYREIACKLNISIHTIYKITKSTAYYKLDFYIYLKVCNFLKIDITDILLVE